MKQFLAEIFMNCCLFLGGITLTIIVCFWIFGGEITVHINFHSAVDAWESIKPYFNF